MLHFTRGEDNKIKLYLGCDSRSSAFHIALIEADLDADIVKVDLREDRILPDGRHYSEVNPKDYVPTL